MKILKILLAAAAMLVVVAPQAFAAEGAAAGTTNWVAITSGFAMAFAAAFAALGQGRVASAACEGLARNPGAAAAIRFALILGLVFIETLALFTFAIVFVKVV
ncbi:MAG TPA: ATP synthase F0 subunit C [Candidatus Acidoferrales bacterium]|nr:ATP synthase F0 subunit C [Candidatus Acidoferrales bacterium]